VRGDRPAPDQGAWTIDAGAQQFRARAVANAAGPRVLEAIGRGGLAPTRKIRLVRGSHIVVRKLFDHPFAYFFQLPDGRIFFAIPYEGDFTLVGTTDRDHEAGLDSVAASAEEIAYLCEGVNGYFRQRITPDDVVWSYAGVRPLVDEGRGKPEAATRGYSFTLDGGEGEPVLLSVFGGKITTYRHLAGAALERLAPHLPVLAKPEWTDRSPLPGGDFPKEQAAALIEGLARDYPFLGETTARRLGRAYGTVARSLLGSATGWDDLGRDFGHGLSEVEVRHLIESEWARTADDVLWRRTKLGLRFSPGEAAELESWIAQVQQ
jgi:glycerol-3-phosphate dehydrogenase